MSGGLGAPLLEGFAAFLGVKREEQLLEMEAVRLAGRALSRSARNQTC